MIQIPKILTKNHAKLIAKCLIRPNEVRKSFAKHSDFRGNLPPRGLEATFSKWQYSDTPYGKSKIFLVVHCVVRRTKIVVDLGHSKIVTPSQTLAKHVCRFRHKRSQIIFILHHNKATI